MITSASYCRVMLGDKRVASEDVFGFGPTTVVLTLHRKKPDELQVTWVGFAEGVEDHELLQENVTVSVALGWDDGDQYEGIFIMKSSNLSISGNRMLSLRCLDKGSSLGDAIRREVLRNVRASDVAILAAGILGLRARVIVSEVIYDHITVGGASIGQLLSALAADEDFEWFVRKNTLYFRPSVKTPSGLPSSVLVFRGDEAGGVKSQGDVRDIKISKTAVGRVAGDCSKTVAKQEDGSTEGADTSGSISSLYSKKNVLVVREGPDKYITKVTPNKDAFKEFSENLEQIDVVSKDQVFKAVASTQEIYTSERARIISAASAGGTQAEQAAAATLRDAQLTRLDAGKIVSEEQLRINVAVQVTLIEASERLRAKKACTAKIVSQSPVKKASYVKLRNAARASFVKWKKRELTTAILGRVIYPGDVFTIVGGGLEAEGPWRAETYTARWMGGTIVGSLRAESPPAEKNKPDASPEKPVKHAILVAGDEKLVRVIDETSPGRRRYKTVTRTSIKFQMVTVSPGGDVKYDPNSKALGDLADYETIVERDVQ